MDSLQELIARRLFPRPPSAELKIMEETLVLVWHAYGSTGVPHGPTIVYNTDDPADPSVLAIFSQLPTAHGEVYEQRKGKASRSIQQQIPLLRAISLHPSGMAPKLHRPLGPGARLNESEAPSHDA